MFLKQISDPKQAERERQNSCGSLPCADSGHRSVTTSHARAPRPGRRGSLPTSYACALSPGRRGGWSLRPHTHAPRDPDGGAVGGGGHGQPHTHAPWVPAGGVTASSVALLQLPVAPSPRSGLEKATCLFPSAPPGFLSLVCDRPVSLGVPLSVLPLAWQDSLLSSCLSSPCSPGTAASLNLASASVHVIV